MRKYIFPFLITLLFFAVFFYFIKPEEIYYAFRNVETENLILAFFLYTLSQITRSIKWFILLKIDLLKSFLINSANIFFNNILPARSGELSWFYYSKKLGVELKYSVWSFFIGRSYDLLGLISVVFIAHTKSTPLFFLFFVLSAFFPYAVKLIPEYGKLKDLKNFLMKEFTPEISLSLFSLSFLSFFVKALSAYVLIHGIVDIEVSKFFVGFLGGELSSILPIHSFMGYGTYETGFLIPLKVAGYEVKEGLKLGFLIHTFFLISSSIWGILSIILLHKLSRKSP